VIKIGEMSVESLLEVVERAEKIYIETSKGEREIRILPEKAIFNAKKIENVADIKISQEGSDAVYIISGTKKARLFFIFPIMADVEQKISVEDGEVVSTKKPWWSFLALGI